MTKIVHFGKYYPPDWGGIESVTQTLAEGACNAGYEVLVICFDKSKVRIEADCVVNVQRYPITIMISSQPLNWAYFIAAVREGRKADIVHLHAPNMLAALASLMIGFKPKLVVHWHGDVITQRWIARFFAPLENLMLRRASTIFATSQRYVDGSKLLLQFLNKVSVVPLGIAPPNVQFKKNPLSPRLADFVAGRKLILSVGRLTAYKGFSVLVEAMKFFPDDVAIVIAGGGELEEALSGLITSTKVESRVMLAGRVTEEELTALYENAYIFCLPSNIRAEAFGVVLMEAMAYGLPIVATNIEGSGVPWVNAHEVSGLNVPVNDARALAAACSLILNDTELRNRYSQGAKERFENNFTESIFCSTTLNAYERIIKH